MYRFHLYSLFSAIALGPPVLAGLWIVVSDPLPVPLTELIVFAAIAFALIGSAALGAAAE